jgi:tRNA G18 (ribose-2'-O)-methylase SpoU
MTGPGPHKNGEPLTHAVNGATDPAVDGTRSAPRLLPVDDPDDPRIAAFRDIRERDLARRGTFIAEGTVVLESLLGSRLFRPVSLLLLRNRVGGLGAVLDRVPAAVPVFVAERAVIDAVAGFPMHRGVLALAEARPGAVPPLDELLAAIASEGGTVAVAVGIANHDNMGGIFRNAAAFAAGAVLVDETSCDPLYRKAIRVSAGRALRVPFLRAEAALAADRLAAHGFRLLALSPRGETDAAAIGGGRGPTALFLGTEGEGLPEALLARMETVRIAMAPGVDSLNVATSAAVVLHRLYSERDPSGTA